MWFIVWLYFADVPIIATSLRTLWNNDDWSSEQLNNGICTYLYSLTDSINVWSFVTESEQNGKADFDDDPTDDRDFYILLRQYASIGC